MFYRDAVWLLHCDVVYCFFFFFHHFVPDADVSDYIYYVFFAVPLSSVMVRSALGDVVFTITHCGFFINFVASVTSGRYQALSFTLKFNQL